MFIYFLSIACNFNMNIICFLYRTKEPVAATVSFLLMDTTYVIGSQIFPPKDGENQSSPSKNVVLECGCVCTS